MGPYKPRTGQCMNHAPAILAALAVYCINGRIMHQARGRHWAGWQAKFQLAAGMRPGLRPGQDSIMEFDFDQLRTRLRPASSYLEPGRRRRPVRSWSKPNCASSLIVIGQIPARCMFATSLRPVCDQDSIMEFCFYARTKFCFYGN